MTPRTTPLFALALVSLLSACVSVSGAYDPNDDIEPTLNPLLHGTDLNTIEKNLGIPKDSSPKSMRAASTQGGDVSATIRFDHNHKKLVMVGGGVQTGVFQGANQSVMNGAVVRNTNGTGTVFYMPSIDSNINVGMVSHSDGQRVVTGIVGRETSASQMTTRTGPGGTASYAGVATYARTIHPQVVTYEGSIAANVNFDTSVITYGTNTMIKTSDTGGASTMTLNGTGTFNGNGSITGTFSTVTLDGPQNGTTSGAFYGNNAGSMGLIFIAPEAAGGAILKEN